MNLGVDAIAGLSNVALCHSLSMLRKDTTAPAGTVTNAGLKLFAFIVIVGPIGAPVLPGANGFEKRDEVRKLESVSAPRNATSASRSADVRPSRFGVPSAARSSGSSRGLSWIPES